MMDYRKILMLRSMGRSQREMERNKIASRETTKEIFDAADRLRVHWPLDDDVTNDDLERLLFPDKYKNVCMYVEPDYPYIHKELAKNGVTLTLLWEEYRAKCYESGETPYMSTQFAEKYRKWARVTKATMRMHVHVDGANHTPQSVKNALSIMYSKEDILFAALKVDESRMPRWCKKSGGACADKYSQTPQNDYDGNGGKPVVSRAGWA